MYDEVGDMTTSRLMTFRPQRSNLELLHCIPCASINDNYIKKKTKRVSVKYPRPQLPHLHVLEINTRENQRQNGIQKGKRSMIQEDIRMKLTEHKSQPGSFPYTEA